MESCYSGGSQLLRIDPFYFFYKIVRQAVAAGIGIEAQETVTVKTIESFPCCDPQVTIFILCNAIDPVIRHAIFRRIDHEIFLVENLRLRI